MKLADLLISQPVASTKHKRENEFFPGFGYLFFEELICRDKTAEATAVALEEF